MSQRSYESANHETSAVDMVMLFGMPVAIAVLLGIIGYLGAII